MALGNRQTDLLALSNFPSLIVKVPFSKIAGSCSFGEVVHVDADAAE